MLYLGLCHQHIYWVIWKAASFPGGVTLSQSPVSRLPGARVLIALAFPVLEDLDNPIAVAELLGFLGKPIMSV